MQAVRIRTREAWEESPLPVIDPVDYRSVLGRFPTGVTIMTARGLNGVPVGVTANSFNTVSLDPPLILWSLALRAPSLAVFRGQDRFAVNLLACDQRELALRFARPSEDKFAGLALRDGLGGAPLIEDAMAHIECQVEHRYPGGDHEIIVGRILRMDGFERDPLVFHRGTFCEIAASETQA